MSKGFKSSEVPVVSQGTPVVLPLLLGVGVPTTSSTAPHTHIRMCINRERLESKRERHGGRKKDTERKMPRDLSDDKNPMQCAGSLKAGAPAGLEIEKPELKRGSRIPHALSASRAPPHASSSGITGSILPPIGPICEMEKIPWKGLAS